MKKIKVLYNKLINSIGLITVIKLFNNDTFNNSYKSIENKYRYNYKIGSGTYGNVFKCTNIRTNKDYAIKIISIIENSNNIKHEINILKKLYDIKYNYSLIDYYSDNYYHYIITPYISGISLYRYVKKLKRVSESNSIYIIKQLSQQLLLLTNNNIIHNDIKLDNVIIDINNLNITLIDFGSSNIIDKSENYNTTLVYAPPEFLNYNIISYQNDIWALGCLFYILLYGKHPFDKNNSNNEELIINNIKNNDIIFENDKSIHISKNTKLIIKKMLEKDPSKRLTINELIIMLDGLI